MSARAAEKLLADGTVVGVVGLRREHGRIGPHVFPSEASLVEMVLDPPQHLALFTRTALDATPKGRLGVMATDADRRALIEMAKLQQLDIERIVIVDLETPEKAPDPRVEALLALDVTERRAYWEKEFERCIKCYGCRNACPVCLCDVCIIEEDCWVAPGHIPPALPFHWIRAWHVSDKCVVCGACEAACPADIPLTVLHGALKNRLVGLFDYEPGRDVHMISPLTNTLEEAPLHE